MNTTLNHKKMLRIKSSDINLNIPTRTLLFAFCCIAFSANVYSQTNPTPSVDQNYFYEIEPLVSTTSISNYTNAIRNVNYYDGLGRLIQVNKMYASPSSGLVPGDLVQLVEYDDYGRQDKQYLAYPTNAPNIPIPSSNPNNGSYQYPYIVINNTQGFYKSKFQCVYPENAPQCNENPYAQAKFDDSSLNRIVKQGAPGNDWKLGSGHEIEYTYTGNTIGTIYGVKSFTVNSDTGDLELKLLPNSTVRTYPKNTLLLSKTKDENGGVIEEFKDKQGRTILKRNLVYSSNGQPQSRFDTYYVYDIYGYLAYVIPPKLADLYSEYNSLPSDWKQKMNQLGYQYRYDNKNRLIEKKIPGKEWEYLVYDKQDRLIAMQDGEMRKASFVFPSGLSGNAWSFTKYDQLGRIIYTGLYKSNMDRAALQNLVNGYGSNNEARSQTAISQNGITYYYTRTGAFPKSHTASNSDILLINYYDNYTNILSGTNTISEIENMTGHSIRDGSNNKTVKGLQVASFARVIPSSNLWEKNYSFYDERSRLVFSHKTNHLGGYTKIASNLKHRGAPNFVKTFHKRTNADPEEILVQDNYVYDYQDRLRTHSNKVGNEPEQLILYNTYDELTQLKNKKVGGTDLTGGNRLQQVDYSYNIRGWMTGINSITQTLSGRGIPNTSDDLFAFKIQYNDVLYGGNVPALYNGNISQTYWKSSTDNIIRGYAYEYDKINRLTHGHFNVLSNYVANFTGAFNEILSYDKNGNILTISRTTEDAQGNEIEIDDLAFTYENNSNVLSRVVDNSSQSSTQGFNNGSSGTSIDYTYDDNGNMLSDLNKGIATIMYNHLNLPTAIVWNSTKKIEFTYNALGVKVQKKVTNGTIIQETDYLNGFQYFAGKLLYFPTSEGYVKNTILNNQNTYDYVFNYVDHLGNIRMSYTKDPQTGELKILEENHYYPFGLKHKKYYDGASKIEALDDQSGKAIIDLNPSMDIATKYDYKYNGKELQDELGLNMYAMDARMYDPAIARWVVQDPIVHHSMSPYVAFDNNPVFWADPSGMDATTISFLQDLYKRSKSGDIWTNNNGIFVNNRTGEEAPAPDPAYIAISLHAEGNFRPENMKYFRKYVESIQINGGIDELIAALSNSLGLRTIVDHGYKIKLVNKRVMFLAIFSHGIEGQIFGDGGNINSEDLNKLKELVEAGGFAGVGVIYLGGCNAGTGMTQSFAQYLANITGSTVIALANDGVAPTGDERSASTMTYGPKHGSKYEGNFYKFQSNTPPTLIGSNIDVIQLLDTQRNLDPNK